MLLHFGAVDWEATVFVNGTTVGTHRGGYDAFTVRHHRRADAGDGPQELVVSRLGSDRHRHAAARQAGEPAARHLVHVRHRHLADGVDRAGAPTRHRRAHARAGHRRRRRCASRSTSARADARTPTSSAVALDGTREVAAARGAAGQPLALPMPNAKLWSPDSPSLYDLKVTLSTRGGDAVDEVTSYFAMRKSSLCKDADGVLRLCLNNKPLFQFGPLDQGWWPDGLYTAPTDEALRYDIEVTKKLGFNMARKHVKVEPDRWYYWARQARPARLAGHAEQRRSRGTAHRRNRRRSSSAS